MSTRPLSPVQEARWHARQSAPGFPWSVSLAARLAGPLDPAALEAALARAVTRHEILRTRFVAGEGGAHMRIEPATGVALARHDWSAQGLVEGERALRSLERELRGRAAGDGTPLAAALARVAPEEHVLVLACSALAADWRALWVLARELTQDLAGALDPEPPVQFADLAQWLREASTGEDESAGRTAWSAFDAPAAATLRLPLELERAARPFELRELARELPPALLDGLRRLAEGRNLALESLLAAAWQAWLARLAERDELWLGMASSGRAFPGLESALG
ncbi:MAG TPA: condensation domain-containing protein, partial [Planctomycetota bacterium]